MPNYEAQPPHRDQAHRIDVLDVTKPLTPEEERELGSLRREALAIENSLPANLKKADTKDGRLKKLDQIYARIAKLESRKLLVMPQSVLERDTTDTDRELKLQAHDPLVTKVAGLSKDQLTSGKRLPFKSKVVAGAGALGALTGAATAAIELSQQGPVVEQDEEEPIVVGNVSTPPASLETATLTIEQLVSMKLIPDDSEFITKVRNGEYQYNDSLGGYIREKIVEGEKIVEVWRTGLSRKDGVLNSDVERGWMKVADEYVINRNGQTVKFSFEIPPEGLTPDHYQYLELGEYFHEKFPDFFENELSSKNLDGYTVSVQFAGEFDKDAANHEYMQIVSFYPGSKEVMIAAQMEKVGSKAIQLRVYFSPQKYDRLQQENYNHYLSYLMCYAMAMLKSGLYNGNTEVAVALNPENSTQVYEVFKQLYTPIVNRPGDPQLNENEIIKRALVKISNTPHSATEN